MKELKFIYLTPLSPNAKIFFEDELNSFHTCRVEEESTYQYLIKSLNQKHKFWIQKTGNTHWKVDKK